MTELEIGLVGTASLRVGQANTARRIGSGEADVLGTPEMIRLMEQASVAALEGRLPPGQTSVGIHLDVEHLAPTPVGCQVTARAELVDLEGRRLTFKVEASDERERVGAGVHRRVLVDLARFQERAQAKGPAPSAGRRAKVDSDAIIYSLRRGLIVSCQARPGWPLRDSAIMAAMARAAEVGGACAIRADAPQDIAAIRAAVDLPIIGLWKQDVPGYEIYITPTLSAAMGVHAAGAAIVALDATLRPHPEGRSMANLIAAVKAESGALVMADISTLEEGIAAAEAGADLISTTLSGYTPYSPHLDGPDLELVRGLSQAISAPVVAEGRIRTPDEARAALDAGAYAVVVGTAITRPEAITERFARALAG